MSIYILKEYVEECLDKGVEPSFKKIWKKDNWRE